MKKKAKAELAERAMPFTVADVAALQALLRGDASADQQKRALTWIIERGARTYEVDYKSDPYDHAFCAGRRSVGANIAVMLKLDIAKLQRAGHA